MMDLGRNAPHVYAMADRFRARGAKVALGGPHATLLPEKASAHCDHLFVVEGRKPGMPSPLASLAVH